MSKSSLDSFVILLIQTHSSPIFNLLNYLNIQTISFTSELKQRI